MISKSLFFFSQQNPQCDLQAQDRCHRIGQTKPVIVYRLVASDTVDQRIIERAGAKRKLEKMVIQKGTFRPLIRWICNVTMLSGPLLITRISVFRDSFCLFVLF